MSHYPERIVCLTEETTETLYLLGQGHRIVGVSGYTVRPPEARQKPKVSAFINARFDKIEALRPDLVLAFSDLQADLAAELVRRGIAVVTFNQRSIAEILQMIRMLGGLVGCQPAAERLADDLEAGLEQIRESASRGPRLRAFFEEWDDPLISGIRWVEELVTIAGGDPIFPELADARLGEGAHRRSTGSRPPRSGDHLRVVVRQEGQLRSHQEAHRVGRSDRGSLQPHPRDQVDLYPAARSGEPHRGHSTATSGDEPTLEGLAEISSADL